MAGRRSACQPRDEPCRAVPHRASPRRERGGKGTREGRSSAVNQIVKEKEDEEEEGKVV